MSATLMRVWESQRQWSLIADRSGDHLDRWRRTVLVLLGVGAVLGTLAAQQTWISAGLRSGFAIASATALAVAAFTQQRLLGPVWTARHTTSRIASEALKAEVFRYLVRIAPYGGADRDAVLSDAARQVDEQADSILAEKVSTAADSRPLPAVGDIDSYERVRAIGQRDWHRAGVAAYTRRAKRLRRVELTTTATGVLLGALAATGGSFLGVNGTAAVAAWVGLATTISGALAAHLTAIRCDELALCYARTATRLDGLIQRRNSSAGFGDAAFVDAVENLLAAQNQGWVGILAR